ncbi:hypothetical protein Lesp02_75510 [Lentzea sp. NBRC 105346]|nr:hypothetical protein Lesp02_75510 [Lentzea sp. NBRC 105346]
MATFTDLRSVKVAITVFSPERWAPAWVSVHCVLAGWRLSVDDDAANVWRVDRTYRTLIYGMWLLLVVNGWV